MESALMEIFVGVSVALFSGALVGIVKILWDLHGDNRAHKVKLSNHGERIGHIENKLFER